MKTTDLLNSLQGREKKEFETVIKMHKRSSLKNLYFFLKKQIIKNTEPDKATLYKSVFAKKYEPSMDYLIRNELRLLNNELEHFLVQKQLEKTFKENIHLYNLWLLRGLKERGLHQEFEAAFKKTIAKAKEDLQYEIMDKMTTLYLRHLITSQEITEELYEKTIREGYIEKINWIQKDAVRKMRASEVMKAFAERTIKVTRPDFSYSNLMQTMNLQADVVNDSYSNYLYLYALSFQQIGLEKIETLQKALGFIAQCHQPEMEAENRKLFILATIALEYYLMGYHQAADEYYLQTLQYAEANNQGLQLTVIFNYFSNCIKLKKYSEAIELFNTHQAAIEANEKVHYRFLCLKAMCHIFLEETEKVMDCIPSKIQQRPDAQYYYFRLVQIIAFCQLEDEETAMRECHNFLKMYRYHAEHEVDVDYETVVRFLLRYAKAKTEVSLKQTMDLEKLKKDIATFVDENGYTGNYLPVVWLLGKI
ncbi:MAG: hypothetical protein R3E32_20010 [Chitinophagales bacterium]